MTKKSISMGKGSRMHCCPSAGVKIEKPMRVRPELSGKIGSPVLWI
jgi:hypothetical protein